MIREWRSYSVASASASPLAARRMASTSAAGSAVSRRGDCPASTTAHSSHIIPHLFLREVCYRQMDRSGNVWVAQTAPVYSEGRPVVNVANVRNGLSRSDEVEPGVAEITAQHGGGIGAEPVVEDAGVDAAKIDVPLHVAVAVRERGIAGVRIQIRRGAVDAAADAAADGHHQAAFAVIRPVAAVLGDATGELGELEDGRVP